MITFEIYSQELFSDMGFLLECKIIRSGIAIVTFQNREDATRAIDYYDKRKLDGKPMHCDMLPNYRASETAVRYLISYNFFVTIHILFNSIIIVIIFFF